MNELGIIIIMTVLLIGACTAIIVSKREWEKRLFVDPKTGYRYMIAYESWMYCSISKEWVDAIVYQGIDNNGEYYTMKKEDFFNKFVKFVDWKNDKH